jgi:hypothetical protein
MNNSRRMRIFPQGIMLLVLGHKQCSQNTHSRLCIAKVKNLVSEGDIYKNQKAFLEANSESNSEEEGEINVFKENEFEISKDKNNFGLGGSSPIPSVHHSFDKNKTLTHDVEDEFTQEEEEEENDKTEDENFLSAYTCTCYAWYWDDFGTA